MSDIEGMLVRLAQIKRRLDVLRRQGMTDEDLAWLEQQADNLESDIEAAKAGRC